MFLFDIDTVAFRLFDYPVSYLEAVGTAAGLASVYLTAKEKLICWPVGIVNIIFFFIMFYQVQLYSDMLLQIYFLVMSFYGWWKWKHPGDGEKANSRDQLKISSLGTLRFAVAAGTGLLVTGAAGYMMKGIHLSLPVLFPRPASFPYGDAFTTVFSIAATILMAVKKKECWILWITVDAVAAAIYFMKGINLVAVEYLVFGLIALSGLINWNREMRNYGKGEAGWEPAS